MKLRYKSLTSILENNKFLRKSIAGFKNDMPKEFAMFKSFGQQMDQCHIFLK